MCIVALMPRYGSTLSIAWSYRSTTMPSPSSHQYRSCASSARASNSLPPATPAATAEDAASTTNAWA